MATFSTNMAVMLKAAEKAARTLKRDFGEVENLQVSKKGPGDFVTAADRKAEQTIFEELSTARPKWGFLMEESGEKKGEDPDHRFIIDPLDGTHNFMHGVPHWSISIALESKGEIVAGLVFDPIKDEMFRAEKGSGAFVNRQRLRVSSRNSLRDGLINCGSQTSGEAEMITRFMNQYTNVLPKVHDVRRMGGAALDLCYVAAGRAEGFWEENLKPWDVAAGMLIVKEAGGYCTTIEKDENPVHAGSILASNALLHRDLRALLLS